MLFLCLDLLAGKDLSCKLCPFQCIGPGDPFSTTFSDPTDAAFDDLVR